MTPVLRHFAVIAAAAAAFVVGLFSFPVRRRDHQLFNTNPVMPVDWPDRTRRLRGGLYHGWIERRIGLVIIPGSCVRCDIIQ